MGDKGIPSLSITADVQRVLNLIDDERHLTAHSLYTSIIDRIQRYDDHNHRNTSNSDDGDPASNATVQKQKYKTFSSSFMKRSSSGIPKQPPASVVPNGKQTDEEMRQVKDILFQSKKHIFDKLEVRMLYIYIYIYT
jgi:hypothetical protein